MRLRLQKFIAQSGICSRRAAESLIRDGKVLLNDIKIAQIGDSIDPNIETVRIEGQLLRPKEKQYFVFNKPTKVLSSKKDPVGLTCLYDLLLPSMRHLFYAGRLDFMSEGLLILTNDGHFSNRLSHPRFGIQKYYHVWVKGISSVKNFLQTIVNEGVFDDGEMLRACSAEKISSTKGTDLLQIVLLEGKNREIRRMIKCFDGKILRLQRVKMGPFELKDLKPGKWRSFNQQEHNFVNQLSNSPD